MGERSPTLTERRLLHNLRKAAEEYVERRKRSRDKSLQFYQKLIQENLLKKIGDRDRYTFSQIFGKERIRVAVVDGTRKEEVRSGIVSFLVIAAPLIYEIDLSHESIRREPLSEEYKVAALIPIPKSIFRVEVPHEEEGGEETEEGVPDLIISPIGAISTSLMTFAEIYTTYKLLTSNERPDVILMDGSLFYLYSMGMREPSTLNLTLGRFGPKLQGKLDPTMAHAISSLPINPTLKIPSPAFTRKFVVAQLLSMKEITGEDVLKVRKQGRDVYIPDYMSALQEGVREVIPSVKISLEAFRKLRNVSLMKIDREERKLLEITENEEGGTISFSQDKENLNISSVRKEAENLLKFMGQALEESDPDIVKLKVGEDFAWLTQTDIDFLNGVGLRVIIEKVWSLANAGEVVLFASVTKDVTSRFFLDNFLPLLMNEKGTLAEYDTLRSNLFSSDTVVLSDALVYDEQPPPVMTVEFDPAVSTIYRSGNSFIAYKRMAQPGMFLRSFHQLSMLGEFRSRVFCLDRLTLPQEEFETITFRHGRKEYRYPYGFSRYGEATVSLLKIMTKDRSPADFGYPEPLFHVDQYVKDLSKLVRDMVDFSLEEIGVLMSMQDAPVKKRYREVRQDIGG